MRIRAPIAGHAHDPRKGTVILTVLVVVVLLALAAYKYADLMSQEYHSAVTFVRASQVRSYAWSGINWVSAALSSSDNINNNLGGNPFYSPSTLQDHQVQGSDGSAAGYFSLASPGDPDNPSSDGTPSFGVICEAGKINLNAVMKMDPTGNTLYTLLMQLPNMTDDVANAIVDWIDQDETPRQNGAESDYYGSLSPPYQAKNNYIDSLDELLLVRGVTPQLLYGADVNRNGMIDGNETDPNGFGAGWSTYLTVYSRELNVDATGNARLYVNDSDLKTLYTNLQNVPELGDMVTFIIMYRKYGGTTSLPNGAQVQPVSSFDVSALNLDGSSDSSSGSSSSGTGSSGGGSSNQISSLYDLINVWVKYQPPKTSNDPKAPTPPPIYYPSPLNDQSQLAALLPVVLDELTTSKNQYLWGRININTASQTVLTALAAIGTNSSASSDSSSTTSSSTSSGSAQKGLLKEEDVQNILANRPPLYGSSTIDPSYQTPAWLMTKANLTAATMKKLEKYITTRSQVYRVQSVGYQNANGPFARLEAVIDSNAGQPRLLMWRDLTELGKGFNWQSNNQ
jgi:type II secretory pathway component PulK